MFFWTTVIRRNPEIRNSTRPAATGAKRGKRKTEDRNPESESDRAFDRRKRRKRRGYGRRTEQENFDLEAKGPPGSLSHGLTIGGELPCKVTLRKCHFSRPDTRPDGWPFFLFLLPNDTQSPAVRAPTRRHPSRHPFTSLFLFLIRRGRFGVGGVQRAPSAFEPLLRKPLSCCTRSLCLIHGVRRQLAGGPGVRL